LFEVVDSAGAPQDAIRNKSVTARNFRCFILLTIPERYSIMKLYSILWENKNTDKRKVALVVLVYNHNALILKRSPRSSKHASKWGFPGGGIDEGETALEAVLRECEEEIGVRPTGVVQLAQNGHITWFKGELNCEPSKCLDIDYSEHTAWAVVDSQSIYDYDTIDGMPEMVRMVLHDEII
jgi:8-oxo-dGTP pyrophosphatase MutT (NUDIX family)